MHKIKSILLISLIIFCTLEFFLHLLKPLFAQLPISVLNVLFSTYVPDAKSGIYMSDKDGYGCKRMKPNLSMNCYYNGYVWHHKTNKNGFREQEDLNFSEIVLI